MDAFTTTTGFTQPAEGDNVTVPVANSLWIGVGQILYIENGGYYSVTSIPNSVSVQLLNLGYTGNAAPATVIGAGKVSPGGVKGADGSDISTQRVFYGSGDPNGVVTATRPAIYYSDDGHLWVKSNAIADDTNWGQLL